MVVTGRTLPKTAPCARPIASQSRAISMTNIRVRTTSVIAPRLVRWRRRCCPKPDASGRPRHRRRRSAPTAFWFRSVCAATLPQAARACARLTARRAQRFNARCTARAYMMKLWPAQGCRMKKSTGSSSPFRRLQPVQAATRFPSVCAPPWASGYTWSRVALANSRGSGDSAVWTISPRMKDDTPRWEGVPARGALSISVCRKRSSYARIGRRRAATGECRSGIGMTVTALLFHAIRKCARADRPL